MGKDLTVLERIFVGVHEVALADRSERLERCDIPWFLAHAELLHPGRYRSRCDYGELVLGHADYLVRKLVNEHMVYPGAPIEQ